MSIVRTNKQHYSVLTDTSGNTIGVNSSYPLQTSVTSLPNVTIAGTVSTTPGKSYTYTSQSLSLSSAGPTTAAVDISDSTIVNFYLNPNTTNGAPFASPVDLRVQVSNDSNFATAINTDTVAGYITSSANIVDIRVTDMAAPYIRLSAENMDAGDFLIGTLHVFKY